MDIGEGDIVGIDGVEPVAHQGTGVIAGQAAYPNGGSDLLSSSEHGKSSLMDEDFASDPGSGLRCDLLYGIQEPGRNPPQHTQLGDLGGRSQTVRGESVGSVGSVGSSLRVRVFLCGYASPPAFFMCAAGAAREPTQPTKPTFGGLLPVSSHALVS
ncbi:hypothetical protein GCM10009650_24480 [Nesterenkonia jeotgali]